jgi:uncharacterized protein YjdB
MRVISLSRTVAAFAALILAGACSDTSGPGESPDFSTGGMTLTPRNATIQTGQVLVLKATRIDANGHRLDGVGTTWTSSNSAVATVSAAGEVLGQGVGHAIITARALGSAQFANIYVLGRTPRPDPKPGKPGMPGSEDGKKLK